MQQKYGTGGANKFKINRARLPQEQMYIDVHIQMWMNSYRCVDVDIQISMNNCKCVDACVYLSVDVQILYIALSYTADRPFKCIYIFK